MLLTVAALAIAPTVAAHPISANLNWTPPNGGTDLGNSATFGVADMLPGGGSDSDYPAGAFFSGVLTVTTPDGLTSTYSVTNVPCGIQTLSAAYPSAFTAGTGTPATGIQGTYTGTWVGITSALVGGQRPAFSTQSHLTVFGSTYLPAGPTIRYTHHPRHSHRSSTRCSDERQAAEVLRDYPVRPLPTCHASVQSYSFHLLEIGLSLPTCSLLLLRFPLILRVSFV